MSTATVAPPPAAKDAGATASVELRALRRRWLVWGHLLPGLLLAACLSLSQHIAERERQAIERSMRGEFDTRVAEIVAAVKGRMLAYEQILQATHGMFSAFKSVEHEEFQVFVDSMKIAETQPGILEVGFSLLVPAADKEAHVAAMRRQGFPDYSLKPEGRRDTYTSSIYIQTFKRDSISSLGSDYFVEPARRHAMALARDTAQIAISNKVALPEEDEKTVQAGLRMYLPVFRRGAAHGTVAERRANIVGWVYAAFSAERLMDNILSDRDRIAIEIFDGEDMSEDEQFFDSIQDRVGGESSIRLFFAAKRIDFGGYTWSLTARSLPDFLSPLAIGKMRLIANGGIALSVLLTVFAWFALHRRYVGRRAAVELRLARDEAEQATQAKSIFLAHMSHEIRTPMNAIIGMSQLALRTNLTPKQRDYVAKIHGAGTALLGIINDILDFSKIEADKIEIETTAFMLDEVMGNVATVVGNKAGEKQLELLWDIPAAVPQALLGDPLRLTQILTNLCNNAIKFTERGEVVVSVAQLEAAADRVKLKFCVRDSGVGMTADQRQRLFQPFSQADNTISRKFGGTGLGLSIAKRFVELMGGSIWVDSVPGAGSTFSFTAWFGQTAPPAARVLPERLNGLRMLIADDSAAARAALADQCRHLPVQVDTVAAGDAALAGIAAAVTAGRPYGLVLLDVAMPGMDGVEVARRVRGDGERYGQPAIVMVTAGEERDLAGVAPAGILTKPVTVSTLVDTLVGIFGAPAGQAGVGLPPSTPALGGLHVLLVEDNAINQQIACELMEAVGVTVAVAGNGQIALDMLAAGVRTDIILMDVQMPVMDGLTATTLIRANPATAAIPILGMTAHAIFEERQRGLAAGMDDYLTKPIEPELLFAALARWSAARGIVLEQVAGDVAASGATDAGIPAIAGVDVAAALRRLGGNAMLYRKLLAQFAANQAGAAAQIESCLQPGGDLGMAERVAHSCKGVAASLGAARLADLAGALEQSLRSRQDPAQLLPRFAAELAQLVAALRAAVPQNDGDESPSPDDGADPHAIVATLAAYLREGDSEAVAYLAAHRGVLRGALGEAYAPLMQAVDNFDFEPALRHLSTVAQPCAGAEA